MESLSASLPLFSIIAVGALAGAIRLFPAPRAAIAVLNRFTLYLAFPLLIVASLSSSRFTLPQHPAFYVFHALGAAALLPVALLMGRLTGAGRSQARVITAGALFGNIAYLGIPYCTAILGAKATGLASLSAALHIIIAMTLAPFLLDRAAAGAGRPLSNTLARIARQPLVWAPFVGLLLRLLPAHPRAVVVDLVGPLGSAAGPVALFMVGLYLWEQRALVFQTGRSAVTLLSAKLLIYPALVWALVWALEPVLPVTETQRAVLVLVAAMPVAVTTFSLAEEFDVGRDLLSVGIVVSTLVSLLTLSITSAVLI